MGRPGAYLEVGREAHGERAVRERVRDFDEIASPLPLERQRSQASRCMYCGVAFCQAGEVFAAQGERGRATGCPLHNLVPEWNDLLARGRMAQAAARLTLTNPFPEFTGRVCPALCEKACNLGLHDEPTTVHDDERAISDWLWANGGPAPLPPSNEDAPTVTVVGSGPAGLACAWELARRGLRVRVVERADRPGGLLMYGIPAMKLPKDVVERRVALMRASGIAVDCEVDAADAAEAARIAATSAAVVLAVGSTVPRGFDVQGMRATGVLPAVEYLAEATRALLDGRDVAPELDARGRDVVVLGGGDTGTDCVACAVRQGAASVRQIIRAAAAPGRRGAGNPWPEWPDVLTSDYGHVEAAAIFGEDPRLFSTDTLEVLSDAEGAARAVRIAAIDRRAPGGHVAGSVRELPAQLVLVARGFSGPEGAVFSAFDLDEAAVRREGAGLASAGGEPVRAYVAGDARTGATLVVNAIADGLAIAARVAEDLRG